MTWDDYQQIKTQAQRLVEATVAGNALALRRWRDQPIPRRNRTWTGMLAGKRAWRGQPVILPDGGVGHIYGIQRGWAAIWKRSPFVIGECEHFVVRVEQLAPYKMPSAVALGHLKLGRKEKPSRRKQAACRVNGAMPCRPGRQRGRPRLSTTLRHTAESSSDCR